MMKHTRSTALIALTIATCAIVASLSANSASGSAEAAGGVKVTVKYIGNGDVDASHRLWIWLFDTPEIGPGAVPVAELSLDQNGDTAAFSGVTAESVWIAVAYDVKGGFTGSAPPPSGSPVTLYGIESGSPTPVTPGEKVEVAISFNDSQRMP